MVLPVVALLIQAVSAQPGDRPVRVWLGSSGPVAPGERVRVYVQTAADGHLIVLRSGTDGRIEVLFPADPADDAFVTAGSYEVRGARDGAAFAALEPPGTGLVIAALSPTRLRPDEFVREAAWNPEALVASWSEADAESALTDIVQRLLGDGYFSYDVVAYTVAPPPTTMPRTVVAESPGSAPCLGCSFVSVTVIAPFASVAVIVEPFAVLVCDAFTAACLHVPVFFHHHRLRKHPVCDFGSQCSEVGGGRARTIALALRPTARTPVPPRSPLPPRFVTPSRPVSPAPIGPRRRAAERGARPAAVAVRAPPLSGPATPGIRAASASGREVRLVMPRSRANSAAPAEPRARPVASLAPVPVAGAAAAPAQPSAAISARPIRTVATVPALVVPARRAAVQAAGRPAASGAAVRAEKQPRVIALPRAAGSGVRARVSGVRVARRQ